MGKPRMIILIRHAQSEGNKNRDIHQLIPDHRVKLTDEGRKQAEEAGRRLRDMLNPDDTVQFFTSPYRRTRETTEGILSSLTSETPEQGPSPFIRDTIKVFEEPRLREQDFGNFQPCSAEMERMWQERADYGHFFYRIPNGESAADAYDRVSGFNESLWRNFQEEDFPSVCVLVTHGLMTRVFLMKWYHWSVEYFEDLRNVNHCEFVIMKKNEDSGKYKLQEKLRTWSELKRPASTTNLLKSPTIPPARKWGGCVGGCNHQHANFPRRQKDKKQDDLKLPLASQLPSQEQEDHPVASQQPSPTTATTTSTPSPSAIKAFPPRPTFPQGRDGGGSLSGFATPADDFSGTESDYFVRSQQQQTRPLSLNQSLQDSQHSRHHSDADPNNRDAVGNRNPQRRPTVQDLENWAKQSGMGSGARAERLGDEEVEGDGDDEEEGENDERHHHHHGFESGQSEENYGQGDGEISGTPSEVLEELKRREIEDKSLRGSVY